VDSQIMKAPNHNNKYNYACFTIEYRKSYIVNITIQYQKFVSNKQRQSTTFN